MNVSRGFLRIGTVHLVIGILVGMYMGGSGDHSLVSVHAHINLLGFTLMMVFGVIYLLIPALTEDWMAKAHFWLHQLGSLVLLIGLYLLMSGTLPESTVGPVLALAEGALLIGVLIFTANIWRRA